MRTIWHGKSAKKRMTVGDLHNGQCFYMRDLHFNRTNGTNGLLFFKHYDGFSDFEKGRTWSHSHDKEVHIEPNAEVHVVQVPSD